MKQKIKLCLLALLPLVATAQKQQTGGVEVGPVASFCQNGGGAYGGKIEGVIDLPKPLALGFGVSVLKFQSMQSVYVPLYASFRTNINHNFNFHFNTGIGLHDHVSHNTYMDGTSIVSAIYSEKGGFYFSTGFGFHGKGTSPFLNLEYSLYSFALTSNVSGTRTQRPIIFTAQSHANAFTVTVGIWITKKSRS